MPLELHDLTTFLNFFILFNISKVFAETKTNLYFVGSINYVLAHSHECKNYDWATQNLYVLEHLKHRSPSRLLNFIRTKKTS